MPADVSGAAPLPGRLPPLPPAASRQTGLDALKAWTTVLVVFHHTAITYGAIGGWYHHEVAPGQTPSSLLLVFFCTVNQAWFMGLFFLLAGRFTPAAIDRRGAGAFIAERMLRLGLPWLVFGYLLGPLTLALARTADGQGFADVLGRLWRHAAFVNGPTWFASALLAFSAVAALAWPKRSATASARVAAPAQTAQTQTGQAAQTQTAQAAQTQTAQAAQTAGTAAIAQAPLILAPAPAPGNRALLLAALGSAAAAFGVRLVWPVGTDVGGWQLGYFPMYLLLFVVGLQAARHGWFDRLSPAQVRLWRRVTWLTLPTLLPLALLAGRFTVFGGPPTGGLNVPSLMYALWEPFVAWGVLLSLLQWAARAARRPTAGAFGRALARRAYAIFVVHAPVLVAVTVAGRGVAAPALLKFAVAGTLTCALCFVLAGALLRVPGLRRVL